MNTTHPCYQCQKPLPVGQWFCNDECKKAYWGTTAMGEKRKLTLSESIERCKELAVEAGNKKHPTQIEIENIFGGKLQ